MTEPDLVRVATAGSVDDGKSTLIGRLLHDAGALPDDQVRAAEQASRGHAHSPLDLSLFTDGLEAEREQHITIDVAYRSFATPRRRFLIADVPGHEQYTRNMVTGASTADVAILLVDARTGVVTQTRRHVFICSLLDIAHVLVVVNKMDEVNYDEAAFDAIANEIAAITGRLPIRDLQFMPVSALAGDMVVARGPNMPWFRGRTLLDYLEHVQVAGNRNVIDFRLPVQGVLRPHQDFRGFTGVVESGIIRVGDSIVALPSMARSTVATIAVAGAPCREAWSGQSVAMSLDDDIDVGRGDLIARQNNLPETGRHLEATVCWFSRSPLEVGRRYLLKHTTRTVRALVRELRYAVSMDTFHRQAVDRLGENDIGRVAIETTTPLVFDAYATNRGTGAFVLIDELTRETAGAGVIVRPRSDLARSAAAPRGAERTGAVLWFTGLPGAGKTAVATRVAAGLAERGMDVEHLDGDAFRMTLGRDLGFSEHDRNVNIERAAHVAALLARHGVVVLASFVSPTRAQRALVKQIAPGALEIFVNAPLDVCVARDPKGMYREARAGARPMFTGVHQAYEPPEAPDLELRTDHAPVDDSVRAVLQFLVEQGILR